MKEKKISKNATENKIIERLYASLPSLAKLVGGDATITDADGNVLKSYNYSGEANYDIIGTQSIQAKYAMQEQKCTVSWSNRVPGAMAIRIPLCENYMFGLNNESISEKFGKLIFQNENSDKANYDYTSIIGTSKQVQEMKKEIRLAARVNSPVMLLGEQGLEQEKYAGIIHNLSKRKGKPFITIKCSAIPPTAFEQIFFGTGPSDDGYISDLRHEGVFKQAEGGTIFLDDLDSLDILTQKKLFKVLDSGSYKDAKSGLKAKIDTRIISSCSPNAKKQIKSGKFLSKLYWYCSAESISIPPLRFRSEDIYPYLKYFIRLQNQKFGSYASKISDEALKILTNYKWSGNVTEMKGCIEQIYNKLGYDIIIEKKHIPSYILFEKKIPKNTAPSATPTLKEMLAEYEKQLVEESLIRNNWSRTDTAAELGIDTATLWRKMVKLNIKNNT
ncbi:MAG: sigma 54-interacting transcriptional regulator [Clostridiales bacterium]|nr:sigma 54-interacting transcriptional regulator [Clostridiales bacterium]